MKDLISVIIPIYNVEKYLPQCLDSVINQTYKNLEIICVNDGSPDDCQKILEEYAKKDNRIIIFEQENSGVGSARNLGLVKASGKYVYFLDSDDYISEDYLSGLYESISNTDADLCYNENIVNVYINKHVKMTPKLRWKPGVYNDIETFLNYRKLVSGTNYLKKIY